LYKKKKILGIILARSGSKRIPNKNILNLCGKPLFYWTILSSRQSKYLDKVIISTDHKKIIKYTKGLSYIKTIVRPKKLAGDKITSAEVILSLINNIKEKFDVIVCLQPTSPLRKGFHIDRAVKKMIDNNHKFLVSACYTKSFSRHMIKIQKGYFEKRKKNPPGYFLNGAIYAAETSYFKRSKSFLTKKTSIFPMAKSRSIDIDTIEDFKLAEKKLRN